MDTIFNIINPIFAANQWQLYKEEKENRCSYRSKMDEYSITLLPRTGEVEIIVPLNEVRYKKKFTNVITVIEYIKMHLKIYNETKK